MIEGQDWFDISPLISERIAVWPGDVAYARKKSASFADGDNLELSSVQTTLHLGAHADAPIHYAATAAGIGARDLALYMGRAQVISANAPRGARVSRAHLATTSITAPRALIRTDSFPNPERWNEDFCSFEPELIDWFAAQGVRLVGIDTPSVDPQDSKALEAHARLRAHDMAVLEGLTLGAAPDGEYALIAMPLKLEGADASPVRAILVKNPAMLAHS